MHAACRVARVGWEPPLCCWFVAAIAYVIFAVVFTIAVENDDLGGYLGLSAYVGAVLATAFGVCKALASRRS